MPNMPVRDPAERFDLAYLFANDAAGFALKELASKARALSARCAIARLADIAELSRLLRGSKVRPEVVIDFPDGLGTPRTRVVEAHEALIRGAVGGDLVINLHHVSEHSWAEITEDCRAVLQHVPQLKVIAQIPFLYRLGGSSLIRSVMDMLWDAGVYCIKDWTGRTDSFSSRELLDYSDETRVRYITEMAEHIVRNGLKIKGEDMLIKVAGRIDHTNARRFVDAGADLLGLSYGKADAVRVALL